MAWRPAKSLVTLYDQLNETYPGWAFLGFLGDQKHANVPSDHNPNGAGVVCALDIGPGGGLHIHDLAEQLRQKPHPDLKYIISNHRITLAEIGWAWGYYDGIDPHDTHIHISVGRGPDGKSIQPYDDSVQWNVKGGDMPITREQEMSESYKATGSYPGKDYDFRFVGTNNYDAMLSFWEGYVTRITKGDEKEVAEAVTGIPNVIGKDYNSPYIGKPVVGYYPQMVRFWNTQPKANEPSAKKLDKGIYKVD